MPRKTRSGRTAGLVFSVYVLFFFQAEDGIRDLTVTGVQTCALPIYHPAPQALVRLPHALVPLQRGARRASSSALVSGALPVADAVQRSHRLPANSTIYRSEEHTSELQSQSNLVCRLLLEKIA